MIGLCKNVCILEFDDVTQYNIEHNLIHPFFQDIMKHRILCLFTEEDARKVLNFAWSVYKKGESLNIHCYAGRSRSQAIRLCFKYFL